MTANGRARGRRRARGGPLRNTIATITFLVFVFPVYWMVATAFKPDDDILRYTPQFFPWPLTFGHFFDAVGKPNFGYFVRNSLVVSLTTVALAIVVGLGAAYAVARFRWRGRKAYLLLVLVVQMAPFEALVIPVFIVMRDFDMLNQLYSLIIMYFVFTLPFTIWVLRSFVAAVPPSLEEAAMVDGCSRTQAFMRVVMPLLWPGLFAAGIFSFITAWNEYLYALTLMSNQKMYTLPVWLASFQSAFGTDWGGTMAASTLFTIPALVFFLLAQGRVSAGVAAGAVKG